MIIKAYKGQSPKIHPDAWIAENAVIIGDVEIGAGTNIWYNVVIRGDLHQIRIGENSNIQDGTVIHVEADNGPCHIGDRVTVGHQSIIHGCKVKDDALIGMGATVLSWADIGKGALVAAGALVKEREIVSDRTLWAGVPAKYRSDIDEDMFTRMQDGWKHYCELAINYRGDDVTV